MNTIGCCFCGKLIAEDEAIKYVGSGVEELYFCSHDCILDWEYENM